MTVTTDRGTEQFTRMDESTKEQWMEIVTEHGKGAARVPERILGMLRSLGEIVDGFSTDQLTHCLQTATYAEKAGADEEVIVASLCHDIGKAVTVSNHGAIAAEILKPYVRPDVYNMIRVHQDFQGRHYYEHLGMDPDAREQYQGEPWFDLTAQFADEWDQIAFDPNGETYPLEHFEPMVRRVFTHGALAS
jgi:predicted HD phosphohydrolase